MELLKSPFLNDPSSLVAQAFAVIYPGTEYEAILVDKITTEDGTEMVGCTTFPDDGTLPLIEVAGHIPAEAVPEILAHELAHIVTVGDEHGPEWKKPSRLFTANTTSSRSLVLELRNRKKTRREAIKWQNQRKLSKSPRQRPKANRQEIQINDMDYTTSAEPKAFADGRPVFCAHDKIVPIKELRENPLNPNKHPDDQIRALAAIIKATGWRQPITVSTRSGLIVKGHGDSRRQSMENSKRLQSTIRTTPARRRNWPTSWQTTGSRSLRKLTA